MEFIRRGWRQIKTGWQQASGRQRIAIVIVAVFGLAAIGASGNPAGPSTTPPPGSLATTPARTSAPTRTVSPTALLITPSSPVTSGTLVPTLAPIVTPPPAAPTAAPVATATPAPTPRPTATRGSSCDPSYPTVCIPPPPPDLDCGEITYRSFKVLQPDPHRFDGDKDGVGCES
jgi:hypothetical protein